MNSKAFRRSHGSKQKSTFISLHFNKSDEEQLEISYRKGGEEAKRAADVSQSNFYVADSKKTVNGQEKKVNECPIVPVANSSIKDSTNKLTPIDSISKQPCKDPFPLSSIEAKSELDKEDIRIFRINTDLSPAIEADEVVDSNTFNHYINNKLEKAKCKTLDLKKEMPPSFSKPERHTQNPFFPSNLSVEQKSTDRTECNGVQPKKGGSYFNFVFQNGISLVRNSVKFHLLIAALAFVCAPIPSWLSGFLVGALLSSIIVYWLYKPQKNQRSLYCVPPSIAYASHIQDDSGILKDWMNELPSSFTSYNSELQFHVSCTRSVYVRLEGSYLRFSFPQKNIPKRAMFNEPRYEMQFVHQQHYDITDAAVSLLPQGLNKKRLWSKKYPICLKIPNHKEAILSPTKKDKFMPRINENNEIVIYLFARTNRDKSLWFSRFLKASKAKMEKSHSPVPSGRMTEPSFENKRTLSVDFAQLQSSLSEKIEDEDEEDCDSFVKLSLSKQQRFEMYMSAMLTPLHPLLATTKNKDAEKNNQGVSLTWLNVLIGRLFFDFLVEDVWVQLVSEKIQKKLNHIKLPFFLSELTVRDVHLGSALPKVHHSSDPCLDERGLWVDLDVSYNGSFHMTLETKLNLDRFKSDSEVLLFPDQGDQEPAKLSSVLGESDEDSLESSSDDECLFPNTHQDGSVLKETGSLPGSKRLMKLMDKLAQSSYFQHAAKNRYVKRAMDDLSKTPLVLTVEVQWLTGTLAINVPPWPTDRLWYGFRGNPSLSLTARPKLGQHVVTITHVTEWIEKKLISEFQKVLVLPNMDDLIIPIMQSDAS